MLNKIIVFYLVSVFSSIAFHLYTKGDIEEKKEEIIKHVDEKQIIKEQKIEENKVKLTEEIIESKDLNLNKDFNLTLPTINQSEVLKFYINNNYLNIIDFNKRNKEISSLLNKNDNEINLPYLKVANKSCIENLVKNRDSCLIFDSKNKFIFTISIVEYHDSQDKAQNNFLSQSYAIQLFYKNNIGYWETATLTGFYNKDKKLYSSDIAHVKKNIDFSKFNKYIENPLIEDKIKTDKFSNFIKKDKKGIFKEDKFIDVKIFEPYVKDIENE